MRALSSFQGTTRSISARNFPPLWASCIFRRWRRSQECSGGSSFSVPRFGVDVEASATALFYKIERLFAGDFFRDSLSFNVIVKMGKGETVSIESLTKICDALKCDIADIVEITPET